MEKELEYRKKPLDYLETAVSKRDLFRIHEENKLPAGLPAVGNGYLEKYGNSTCKF